MRSALIVQNKESGITSSSQSSLVDSVFYENSDHENVIVIGNDSNANFRTYYMALLKGIQQKKDPQLAFYRLKTLKKLLYRKSTTFDCIKNIPEIKTGRLAPSFSKQKCNPNYIISELPEIKNPALTSIQIKKLIAQFLHNLTEGSRTQSRVQVIFSRYPFMHILLPVLFRALLYLYHGIQQARKFQTMIPNSIVFENLGKLFKMTVKTKSQKLMCSSHVAFKQDKGGPRDFKISCFKSFTDERIFIVTFVKDNEEDDEEEIQEQKEEFIQMMNPQIQSILSHQNSLQMSNSHHVSKIKKCESIQFPSELDKEQQKEQILCESTYKKFKGSRRFTQQTYDSWNFSEKVKQSTL